MIEFEKMANSIGGQTIYRSAVQQMDLIKHPDFLRRPIKVLDVCGGTGQMGKLLQQRCEENLGQLSPQEFGELVDYVNIDIDHEALQKSPGRTIMANIVNMHDLLSKEDFFDYMLLLNQSNSDNKNEQKHQTNMPIEIQQIILNTPALLAILLARINLASAALLIKKGGQLIHMGFISQEVIAGTAQFCRENGLGLKIEKSEKIPLDEPTKDLFVTIDTGKTPGSKSFAKTKKNYPPYQMVVMKNTGALDPERITNVLREQVDNYNQLVSYRETQERFGTW